MSESFQIDRLLAILEPVNPIIIQPHDFPDHDALCASFGLYKLLTSQNFHVSIKYGGEISSMSLQTIVDRLAIPVSVIEFPIPENTKIIVIDSNPLNTNIKTDLDNVIAVIDHHFCDKTFNFQFSDVRLGVGACCSIIESYYHEKKIIPEPAVATALLAGIQTDTDFLTRKTSHIDLDAFYRLFDIGDAEMTARIIRSSLSVDDIPAISEALSQGVIYAGCYFVFLNRACSQEVLAIVADFLIHLREIRLAVVIESGKDVYRVSARSKDPLLSAAGVLKKALFGIGTGGGHGYMAGGIIRKSDFPGEAELWKSFVKAAWYGNQK